MMFPNNDRLRSPFRVVAKGDGWIDTDRPLPIELRPAWTPVIVPFASTASESGLEHFTIQFKFDTYDTHFDDKGYNAMAVYDCNNCFVRNVNVIDATNGIFLSGNEFVTVSDLNISITADRGRNTMATRKVHGHHAAMMAHGAYNLQTRLYIGARYYHDLSVDGLLHLSVFSDLSGADINIDNHKAGVHNNLFTNINTGAGTRPWDSGGDAGRGADSGGNSTWWNVYSPSKQLGLPMASGAVDCSTGPMLNWIGQFVSRCAPCSPPFITGHASKATVSRPALHTLGWRPQLPSAPAPSCLLPQCDQHHLRFHALDCRQHRGGQSTAPA
jgi:hypothetical protein